MAAAAESIEPVAESALKALAGVVESTAEVALASEVVVSASLLQAAKIATDINMANSFFMKYFCSLEQEVSTYFLRKKYPDGYTA
jgi:hypothetical protein